ncbi:MAG: thioredoxin family protein [Phreatobacter sp.]|uniref:thioredoxin family protein n=1 Tax=Phreatobacter sp. TaxID=1966341 RepID=UPI00273525D2|nr:thioredoxin family protein [Phreatobacter sp.]MDP2802175.1 thioredoxin family protein [Phreatobacter sp.]
MRLIRWLILLTSLAAGTAASPAYALELLMFERAGCPWCVRWNREVAPAYEASEEGRIAPLRRINMDRGQPAGLALKLPVHYSPTFVLMHEGREIGRLIGYIDASTFWGLLTKMVRDHRERSGSALPLMPVHGRPG